MKPIKNVFPASEGSEKWYSVNEGESTKMLGGRKRDEAGSLGRRLQLCPLFSIALTLFQRHIILLEIVVLANSTKNRNIKAHDVNLISIARSTDFCLKTTYVSMFLCFRLIVGSSPFGKEVSHEPPYPLEITAFEPPLPLGISNDLPWGVGGGVWLFSGTTQWRWMMEVDESEWGWIKVDESDWRWIGGWRWMKMDDDEWHWMKVDEGGYLWMKVKPRCNEGPRARLSLRFQVTR